MKVSTRYIPGLITLALLSLIGLQAAWLFFVYEYKRQEFKNKTREAVLETTERLQRNENARLIINNIDSLLVVDDKIRPDSKEEIRVLVSRMKNKLKFDTLHKTKQGERELRIIMDTSTTTTTTVMRIDSDKKQKVIIRSKSHIKSQANGINRKARELEELFLKMAVSAKDARKNNDSRIDSSELRKVLRSELLKRGIDLIPEYGVSFFPKDNRPGSIDYHVVANTPGYRYILPAMVTLPLFPGDVFGGNMYLKVGYRSTGNFVIRQMAGLLALSLSITILIGFVMIYIFRRMLSQEKLHQIKNDFINNMTHELKTPIATISLALDAINNPQVKNNEERFGDYTRILKEENKKLNDHVERVLQMAMLDKGQLQLSKKPVNLVSLIKASIDRHKLQIAEQKAEVYFNTPEEKIMVNADEHHLLTVFNNLLDNALKYSFGSCIVRISMSRIADHIQISVKDNGIGIADEQKQKVFEKFYRAQGGNLHDVKGFGLGLSYAKSIIEAHGGTIALKSEKGRGSEFVIYLKGARTEGT